MSKMRLELEELKGQYVDQSRKFVTHIALRSQTPSLRATFTLKDTKMINES
jgi:hypothetical protein